jgi:hypothetical protein
MAVQETRNLERDSRTGARDERSFERQLDAMQAQIAKLLLDGLGRPAPRATGAAEVARTGAAEVARSR